MSKRKHAIEAYFQRAARLQAGGQAGDAERMYREILAAVPTHADSLHMLGVLALQAGQPQAALPLIDQAIAANPRVAGYHLNRANALHRLGRGPEAVAACQEALRLDRSSAGAQQILGHVLSDLGRGEEALAAYREAARRKPGLFDIHNNLGVALRHAGRLEEAEQALREALRREPGEPGITANLANVLKEIGRVTEAEALLRDALRARPDDLALRYNFGLLLLLVGKFREGWAGYEARSRAGAVAYPPFTQPRWMGEPLQGRTLLVHAEQGLGDTMQFCRYVPLLAERVGDTGRVIFQVPRRLARLLATLQGVPSIVAMGEPLAPFDFVCPLLSLPGLFATTPDTVPHAVPYLGAERDRVVHWCDRLGCDRLGCDRLGCDRLGRDQLGRDRPGAHGFKVGIAWQGNPSSQAELGRSIRLAHYLVLAQVPGVRLISLQRHDGLDQLAQLPTDSPIETLGETFDAGTDAFLDAAAVIESLDLVITSDTSIAHLAGALGRPVWVALQHVPDWRWMLPRSDTVRENAEADRTPGAAPGSPVDTPSGTAPSDTPWYPTMRLFRQTQRGDWAGVFERIAAALGARIDTGATAAGVPSWPPAGLTTVERPAGT